MSRISEREVARRLTQHRNVEPPAGLLERIRSEIPEEVAVSPEIVPGNVRPFQPAWRRQRWLIAASLVAMIGMGLFALRLRLAVPALEVAEEPASAERSSQAVPEGAPPPASRVAPKPQSTDSEVDAVAGAPDEDLPLLREEQRRADRQGPYEPVQPVEIPSTIPEPALRDGRSRAASPKAPPPPAAEAPLRIGGKERKVETDFEEGIVEGVEGGVVGGVEGGVAGGVPGGVVGGVVGGTPGGVFKGTGTYVQQAPTTGGTAEPNDEAYGDVFFKSYGVNPFIDTEEDRLSTFGLDVDTGSYTVVRRYLDDGNLPPAEAIRVEEFVNFFDYRDPAPARGDFAIRAEGAPTPFGGGELYRVLRFNLRARDVSRRDRKPAVLTFVVDVSGSMDMENRLGLVKRALGLLLGQLRDNDQVGLVVYGSQGRVLLEPTSDKGAIRRAIDRLVAEGSTNAEEGLKLAYDLASRRFEEGAINRVILCSDGVANVGATGPDSILARIGREARRGIELTTVGFGMGNYNDVLMEQLANKGDGSYAYVDSLDEARRVFVEGLTGTLQTVAKDAKVQVEFNPEVVARYRLLGYENRDVADEKFRDDSVDAGEVGAGHSVTALYEVKLQPNAPGRQPLATLSLRYRSAETGKVSEVARDLRLADLARTWEAASPALRLASLVAEYAEILRSSYWAKGASMEDVATRAQNLVQAFPGKPDVADFAHLSAKAAQLKAKADRDREPQDE